jgi:hypothetical protein
VESGTLSDEEESERVGWDDQMPAHVEANFREVLGHLKDLKKVSFPRSMWPEPSRGQVKGSPYYSSSEMVPWRPAAHWPI